MSTETERIEDEIKAPLIVDAEHAEAQLDAVASIDKDITAAAEHAAAMIAKAEKWRDKELERLEKRRQYYVNSLAGYAYHLGEKTVRLIGGTVKIRAGRERVEILDEASVPAEMLRTIPERHTPDKSIILAHIRATGEIPGGCDLTRGEDTVTVEAL